MAVLLGLTGCGAVSSAAAHSTTTTVPATTTTPPRPTTTTPAPGASSLTVEPAIEPRLTDDFNPFDTASVLGRMGVITVIALGLCFVSKPLGFGVLGGLAVFQILLIANVARSMAKSGPMTSVDDVINANVIDDNEPVVSPTAIEGADDARGGA